jgi:predicted methyltransferase
VRAILAAALFVLTLSNPAAADITAKVEAALSADGRPQADVDRDRNRRPLETLQFFGMSDGMTVVELFPGGGWYTRVLAPVLAENGKLHVALGTGRVADTVLTEPGFARVSVLETSENIRRDNERRIYLLDEFKFGISNVDMVEGREIVNRQVYEVLKPGGLYGIVDHTRRHMEPANHENRRRIDPVLVIRELTAIGFEFVDFTDLHYRADDELEYEVGRRSVTGNTDRFTFLFRKPE